MDWHRLGRLHLPTTKAYVQSLLQTCIEVEHSTIPLYLTTQYSIVDQSSFAAKTMRSVVMEEMLHMVNAANVLNAIGGTPSLDHPDFIPKYPLVLPMLNMSADIVWFTRESIQHYQILESTPPGGYEASISAAYLHVVNLLTQLVNQHGEAAVFSGNRSLQVEATISSGQVAPKVYNLGNATAALLGVADQGGGCPVKGHNWPQTVNISAGSLGGNVSHAARYQEILDARAYRLNDSVGEPTGENQSIDWGDVRRFSPNPTIDDFAPRECVDGGSWIVRNSSFFVQRMWDDHNHTLAGTPVTKWEDCAAQCVNWTINSNQPLAPCAMWSWNSDGVNAHGGVAPHSCLLAQGGGPVTKTDSYMMSGCLFGSQCNHSLPNGQSNSGGASIVPPPSLDAKCQALKVRGLDFAKNYTAMLVQLHNVFNGHPDTLYTTISGMYMLKTLAIGLMETADPRISQGTMGIGPPWQYVAAVSEYEARGRRARPWATALQESAPLEGARAASLVSQ